MRKLTMEELNRIEFFGGAKIGDDEYTFKFYEGKSEIRMNGELVARIDNSKSVTDESRVEYVETGWIPVTERLPEMPEHWWDRQEYLVSYENGLLAMLGWYDGWNCSGEEKGGIVIANREYEMHDVVAWMPLPKPYKEEKEDEEV